MDLKRVEEAEEKFGIGRFRLSSLLQKRVQEIIRGAPALVDMKTDKPINVALEEVLAGRISLELYDGTKEANELDEAALDMSDDALAEDDSGVFEL